LINKYRRTFALKNSNKYNLGGNMNQFRKIAAAQLAPVFLNKEQTVQKACEAIKEAGENGCDFADFFVVLF
jgi:hypothetical protein